MSELTRWRYLDHRCPKMKLLSQLDLASSQVPNFHTTKTGPLAQYVLVVPAKISSPTVPTYVKFGKNKIFSPTV